MEHAEHSPPIGRGSCAGMIVDVEAVSRRARLVTVAVQQRSFSFSAGQAVLVGAHGQPTRRPYSIASSPRRAATLGGFELLVGGDPTVTNPALPLQVGTIVDIDGPTGRFTLPRAIAQRHLLFVAGGTGIAPIRSMIDDCLSRDDSRSLTLVYSARSAAELAFLGEWRSLAAIGRLTLHAFVTRADAAWEGACRRVRPGDLAAIVDDPFDTLCFVCGPASLVHTAAATLAARGVPGEAIRMEEWAGRVTPDRPVIASCTTT
jgi:ring-1,2-phenylacetyl-CoA epoxidase subunit PaaE